MLSYLNFVFYISTIIIVWAAPRWSEEPCRISVLGIPHRPMILNLRNEFLYPKKGDDAVEVGRNQTILVGCPGTKLPSGAVLENAKCISNTIFLMNDTLVDLNATICDSKVKGIARYTNKSCEQGGREIEIGFQLPDAFLRIIQICFDSEKCDTFYSHFNLSHFIGDHETIPSPNFKQDDFCHIRSINALYKRENQRRTVNTLLGLPENDTTYIQEDSEFYFSRGHLTAKSDFVFDSQQEVTFHLVNAAPQWQTFNGGNWEQVEDSVRHLAEDRDLDLSIYTGTLGLSTLPNNDGIETQLYLFVNGDDRQLPVPQFYWKVILHQATKKAVAIIGVNNPFAQDLSTYLICKDVSLELAWLNYHRDEPKRGFVYACEVEEFRIFVPQLPKFEVSGLLI